MINNCVLDEEELDDNDDAKCLVPNPISIVLLFDFFYVIFFSKNNQYLLELMCEQPKPFFKIIIVKFKFKKS